MFQQFMGTIADSYDDVGGFFDDLLTKDTISDIIKVGATGATAYGKRAASDANRGPMVDFDDTMTDVEKEEEKKLQISIQPESKQNKVVESVNYRTINDEWINRLRGIATKTPYFNPQEEEV